jgi:hypothetical protein
MSPRFLLPFAAVAACASAASIRRGADSAPGILSFPLEHAERSLPILGKRAADTEVPILNITSTSYLIERKRSTSWLGV